jgi:RNA polymerase sigma factor (sigma-70 family)
MNNTQSSVRYHLATDDQLIAIFKYDHFVDKQYVIELINEMTRRRLLDTFIVHHIRKSFDRFSNKRKYEYEDLIQWGYFAISEGLKSYEVGRGAISTLCHLVIERRMLKEYERSSSQKRTGEVVSLNVKQDDDNATEYLDRLVESNNVEKTVVNKVMFSDWFDLLDEKEERILKLFADGYSMNEIGKIINYSVPGVSKKFHQAMVKINPDYVKRSLKELGLMTRTKGEIA